MSYIVFSSLCLIRPALLFYLCPMICEAMRKEFKNTFNDNKDFFPKTNYFDDVLHRFRKNFVKNQYAEYLK